MSIGPEDKGGKVGDFEFYLYIYQPTSSDLILSKLIELNWIRGQSEGVLLLLHVHIFLIVQSLKEGNKVFLLALCNHFC